MVAGMQLTLTKMDCIISAWSRDFLIVWNDSNLKFNWMHGAMNELCGLSIQFKMFECIQLA